MSKQDLTEYSDSELSLMVFNDEGLYRMRRRPGLKELLEEYFVFTEEQWEQLENDILEEDGYDL